MKPRLLPGSRGFTLVEVLVVVVIIGILAALAVPLMKPPSKALQIKAAADLIKSELLLARQQAQTLNASVEVRFFQETSTSPFTAYQIFNLDENTNAVAFNQLRMLPAGLILPADDDLCPLLKKSSLTGIQTNGVPAVNNWSYAAFDIMSSGQLKDVADTNALVTLVEKAAPIVSGKRPANYAEIRIQPLTGMVSITQP